MRPNRTRWAVSNVNPQDEDAEDEVGRRRVPFGKRPYLIAMFVIAILVAGIGGYFIGKGRLRRGWGRALAPPCSRKTSSTRLSPRIATTGSEHDISAREAIDEPVQPRDRPERGRVTYNTPSAETLIAYVRTEILLNEADARGIEVTDDEVAAYAENTYGHVGLRDARRAKRCDREAAGAAGSRATTPRSKSSTNQVVPAVTATVPEQPEQPADWRYKHGARQSTPQYIIELAGDEWDAEAGTWASTDGPYYLALEGDGFHSGFRLVRGGNHRLLRGLPGVRDRGIRHEPGRWTEFANTLFARCGHRALRCVCLKGT